ncbi:MAG: cupin domain-containing protein [bacterium]|nr:cupin domain-containing protein [bacterium]MCS7310305.1 cupin domain-containing protein [Armatimonadota bacterium]MDW8104704.1 cupin domain-containing protein [Armatimonadota bacterium]
MNAEAQYWISVLGLQPHPEGGYYRETYRSEQRLMGCCLHGHEGPRVAATAIYFLLPGGEFSALHRLRSDEMWHFYTGSSLTLHIIDDEGNLSQVKLGTNPQKGESFQAVVRAGCWFGATVDDPEGYALVGCTVAPGFEFEDFELGDRQQLLERYPQHRDLIERLTR